MMVGREVMVWDGGMATERGRRAGAWRSSRRTGRQVEINQPTPPPPPASLPSLIPDV